MPMGNGGNTRLARPPTPAIPFLLLGGSAGAWIGIIQRKKILTRRREDAKGRATGGGKGKAEPVSFWVSR